MKDNRPQTLAGAYQMLYKAGIEDPTERQVWAMMLLGRVID